MTLAPPGARAPTTSTAVARPSVATVLAAVQETCGVDVAVLRDPSRNADAVVVRHLAMLAARYLTPATLREIGEALGGRDHTTVIYGIRRAELRLEVSRDLQRDYQEIRRRVGESLA